MNGVIRWVTEHPIAANLAVMLILALGLSSFLSITQKTFPEFSLEVVNITVHYPGAAPSEIEQSIVRPIENQLAGIHGIDVMTATAREGEGAVSLSLQLGEDVSTMLDEIKTEIGRIDSFPDDAEAPLVVQQQRLEQALEITLYGAVSERALKREAKRLEKKLERLPGVSFVQLGSVRADELSVEIDRDTLDSYSLTLEEVGRVIANNSLELPGGSLDSSLLSVPLRTLGRNYTAREFEDIIVRMEPGGAQITIRDIARVKDGFEEQDLANVYNGDRAISVSVYRVGEEQVLELVETVRNYLNTEFVASLPKGLNFTIWQNDAKELQGRIDLLMKNAVLGLALVLLCLTLFLDFRLASWAATGIGVSFIASFIVMNLMDLSINMISLFGFILAIGIVVDNAIVIGENVFRNAENGLQAQEAAVVGTQRMAVPVIFSALTTVVAFTPLLLLPGMLGKLLGDIPTVVIIVLLLSMLQSLFILPKNLASVNFSANHNPNIVLAMLARIRDVVDKGLRWVINVPLYRLLCFSTKRWMVPLAVVVALMVLTMGLLRHGYVKFNFFPSIEGTFVTLDLKMVDGTAFEHTAQVASHIGLSAERAAVELESLLGERVLPRPLLEGVKMGIGQGAATTGPNGGPGEKGGQYANVVAKLIDAELRDFPTSDFEDLWRREIGEIAGLEQLNMSSNVVDAGDPIALELSLPDGESIQPVLDKVHASLSQLPGVFELRDDASTGQLEYTLSLKSSARHYGVSLSSLASQMRHGFFGYEATRVQRADEYVRVIVRLPAGERDSFEDLLDTRIRTSAGELVPLREVATLDESRSPSTILRRDGRTITTVLGDVDFAINTAQEVNDWVRQKLVPELTEQHPGLLVEFGGEQRAQGDAGSALGNSFAAALIVIFALLALVFRSWVQPIIVMAAIPLGLIGAVAGHLLVGIPLGLLSIFGIIGLSGVVINNSLVMIDLYNEYLGRGYSTQKAVIQGTQDRFRPILMTSITTFLGVYPLIMETSQQAQFLIPLAVSIGYGVLFGTLIIVLAVPALFVAQAKLFRSYVPIDEMSFQDMTTETRLSDAGRDWPVSADGH